MGRYFLPMIRRAGALALAALLVVACGPGSPGRLSGKTSATQDPDPFIAAPSNQLAQAGLINKNGSPIGTARFREERTGVRVDLRVTGLSEGLHGVHIHAFGRCEPPSFDSAGGHYNPNGKVHGHLSTNGPHAGDLGNILVKSDGTGSMTRVTPNLSLAPGAPTNFAAAGLAIVVHEGPDDEKTDPSGNSGPRVACGVVKLLPPAG